MEKMNLAKRLLIVTIMAMFHQSIKSQVTITYAMDSPGLVLMSQDVSKYEIIDKSYLNLIYHVKMKASANDTKMQFEDDMILLIGKKYTSFYSKNLHELDVKRDSIIKLYGMATPEQGWQGYEIRTDLQKKELTVDNRIPFTKDVCRYTEPSPQMKWNIENSVDSVFGYKCKKATTEYGGRKYIVWFTNDIPISTGPWKFAGLPGAILKVTDTEHNFSFECIGLTQQTLPIVNYDWKYKNMSKTEWIKFEKNMYEHAGLFISSTGARVIIMDNSEKGSHPISEQLSLFYNPMEK